MTERERHSLSSTELIYTYGQPEVFDTAEALRLLALDEAIHPHDAIACTYPSQEAADAFDATNQVVHGHPPTLHLTLADGRVLGLIDLRPALARFGQEPMAPLAPGPWWRRAWRWLHEH